MASFTPTIAGQLSGSIGAYTFSHNKGGPYIRLRSNPTQPNSNQQQLVKAFLGALATAWSSVLNQSSRDGWDTYAAQVQRPKPGGGTQFLTGLAHFIRSNVPRGQADTGLVLNAPTVFDVGTYTPVSGAAKSGTQTYDITFDNTDAWANEDTAALLIYIGRPQGVGVKFFKGPYRFSGSILGNSTTPPTSPITVSVPFPIVNGQRVWFRAEVTRADGRLSDSMQLSDIVT